MMKAWTTSDIRSVRRAGSIPDGTNLLELEIYIHKVIQTFPRTIPRELDVLMEARRLSFKGYWPQVLETLSSDNPNYSFVPDHFLFIIKLYIECKMRFGMIGDGYYPHIPFETLEKIEQNLLNLDRYHLIPSGELV